MGLTPSMGLTPITEEASLTSAQTRGDDLTIVDCDKRIITALQEDGRAPWSRVGQAVGVSAVKAARRGEVLFKNRVVGVSVVSALEFSPAPSDLYEVRIRCHSGSERDVARVLAERKDTRWVAILSGEFNIAAEFFLPRGGDVDEVLIDGAQLHPDITDLRSALVLRTFKVAQDWNKALVSPEASAVLHVCDPSHFSRLDHSILACLKVNGRRSAMDVAHELRVDESTVRRRLTRMLERGCARVMTIVQPSSLGYEHEVQLELEVLPHQVEEAAAILARQAGVRYLAATLSSASLVCEVVMPDAEALYDFMTRVIGSLHGLQGMVAHIELLVVKRSYQICPWAQ